MNDELTPQVEVVIPELVYHGRNTLCRAIGNNRNKIYTFGVKNEFKLRPDSFEDLYSLLKVDGIVLATDPMSKVVKGRPNYNNNRVIKARKESMQASKELEISDRLAEMKKFKEEKFQEKMEGFGHDIANGKTNGFPEDAEEQAREYAEVETATKFGTDGKLKVSLPKMQILPGINSL